MYISKSKLNKIFRKLLLTAIILMIALISAVWLSACDDDFYPATDEQLLQRLDELNSKQYPDDRKDIIIAELKRRGVSIYL